MVNKHQLINHLKQHDVARPLTSISIVAHEFTDTQTVVGLTDYIKGQLPDLNIIWSVKSATSQAVQEEQITVG